MHQVDWRRIYLCPGVSREPGEDWTAGEPGRYSKVTALVSPQASGWPTTALVIGAITRAVTSPGHAAYAGPLVGGVAGAANRGRSLATRPARRGRVITPVTARELAGA